MVQQSSAKRLKREMGTKLANFRRKLATVMSDKNIAQGEFGKMFGGYTRRQITSYETGVVEVPGRLLYLIFRAGHSIDGIFAESEISISHNREKNLLSDFSDVKGSALLREKLRLHIETLRADLPDEAARGHFDRGVEREAERIFKEQGGVLLRMPDDERDDDGPGQGAPGDRPARATKKSRRR
jgi:hypothetical protein